MEVPAIGVEVMAKVRRRLLPLMIVCFFIAFLDRGLINRSQLRGEVAWSPDRAQADTGRA